MPFATFTNDLHLGHELIDRQHASLYDAVNQLHDVMRAGDSREELGQILAFLRIYTMEHFSMEESFMQKTGYPGLKAHQVEHERLIQQVKELEAKHSLGSFTLSLTIMTFLKTWLDQHISVEDRKLVQHLHGGGVPVIKKGAW